MAITWGCSGEPRTWFNPCVFQSPAHGDFRDVSLRGSMFQVGLFINSWRWSLQWFPSRQKSSGQPSYSPFSDNHLGLVNAGYTMLYPVDTRRNVMKCHEMSWNVMKCRYRKTTQAPPLRAAQAPAKAAPLHWQTQGGHTANILRQSLGLMDDLWMISLISKMISYVDHRLWLFDLEKLGSQGKWWVFHIFLSWCWPMVWPYDGLANCDCRGHSAVNQVVRQHQIDVTCTTTQAIRGVQHGHGVSKNGWFISWEIPSFEMDDLGLPLF